MLVNNAAINDMFENPLLAGQQSMFENYPLEMWDQSWKVNVSGVFLCSQILRNSPRRMSRLRGRVAKVAWPDDGFPVVFFDK